MTGKNMFIFESSFSRNKMMMNHSPPTLFFLMRIATFHLSRNVNNHNIRIWGLEQPHETVKHLRDSQKVNMFCTVSKKKFMVHSSSWRTLVTGSTYLDMLFPQLQADRVDLLFQQDRASQHWQLAIR